ncbi:DEKNAAC104036 [Brettanomyces naardenensis]|uniref:aminodeoxychorismate synthase n=1 Tax=Brettanomyces naardenensis TaxID=13370 RepID=A0A448YQI9_BRENA|nr:DEKNAAC104036 [Brettanomyces naardenensis]
MPILLVDSYDSFTFSLENLLERSTGDQVLTIRNDSFIIPRDQTLLDKLLDSVQAVVIGPGPGSPENPHDIGIIPYIFKRKDLPILGICLGFQCLCLNYGCHMEYLEDPIHGQAHVMTIIDKNEPLFKGFPDTFKSVRYHSIYINGKSDVIVPLVKWNIDDTLMAAKHKKYPHYGVQYHPESICSEMGEELVKNFWELAQKRPVSSIEDDYGKVTIHYEPLMKDLSNCDHEFHYQWRRIEIDSSVISLCESLKEDFLLLNSASTPGNWSIIGLPIEGKSDVITHSTENPNIVKRSKWKKGKEEDTTTNLAQGQSIWNYLSEYMSERYYTPEIDDKRLQECPFIGGLVGFMSYEEGRFVNLERLKKITEKDIPDTKMCFVERFIAREGREKGDKGFYVVSIRGNDDEWLDNMKEGFQKEVNVVQGISDEHIPSPPVSIILPDKHVYLDQFQKCQEYLRSGDSYELCLTTTTKIHLPRSITSWDLYKKMIARNASPYSLYLDFGDSQLLSTSPERFLYWDEKKCQMRPIKGTVKKSEGVDYEEACRRLLIPKEMGENLMIVDLIRHDMYTLLKNVKVSKLMGVEEYQTLYQLVSVIEGDLEHSDYRGIDILSLSLPPGSMTGAPKKRSVELLQELEGENRRGIYSGIAGYWGVNDRADWSVVIRSIYGYEGDVEDTKEEKCMRCGAGGAITVLSNGEGEWEEMGVKLESVLNNELLANKHATVSE